MAGLNLPFHLVQFFAQFAVVLLEIEHLLAQVLEVVHGLPGCAQASYSPLGSGALGTGLGGGLKFLQRTQGRGIAECAVKVKVPVNEIVLFC